MKTVFLTIPSSPLSLGYLRTRFLSSLCKGDVRIVLIVPSYRKEYYAAEFAGRSDIIVEAAPPDTHKSFEECAHRLLRQSIPSTTIYNRQMHALYGPDSMLKKIPVFVGTRILWYLGHLRFWREFLRFAYSFSPYAAYLPLFDRYTPDLVVATTLFDRMDLGVMKAARKRGVPIVGMPKSWDSLTSKCFTPIKPDWMLAQNGFTKDEAIRLSDIGLETITVVGIPQFDFYFAPSLIQPREEFLASIGVKGRYVLFTGGGLDLFPDECEVLSDVIKRMEHDEKYSDLTLVYRPHPNYGWCTDAAKSPKVIVASSHTKILDTTGGWEFEPDDIKYLLNSLYHADVVLHMASTIAIEVALQDRPMIGVACDGAVQKPFYRSSERYYHTDHFAPMARSGGMKIATTVDDIMNGIDAYHATPSLDAEGRARIVREEVVYTDGKASERIANKIREILKV